MEEIISKLLEYIGENPAREGLIDTPRRVKHAWEHIMSGYKMDPVEILNKAIFQEECNHMIIVRNIS